MWADISEETGRLATHDRFGILDPRSEDDHATILSVAAQTLALPSCFITVVDAGRRWLLAHDGHASAAQGWCTSLVDIVISTAAPLVVADTWQDPATAGCPAVRQKPHPRFFAGVPLTLASGETIGTLAVADGVPRPDFGADAPARLAALGRLIVTRLELACQTRRNDALMARAAIIARLLAVAAEAGDFPAAIAGATTVLLQATQALFCHVYRQSPGGGGDSSAVPGAGGSATPRI